MSFTDKTKRWLNENKESLTYAEGVEVTDAVHQHFGEIYSQVNNFVETANKLKGTFHIDSKEYKTMMTALNDLKRYSDHLNKKMIEGEAISIDEFKALELRTTVMGMSSQNYLDAKELSQSTSLGQNRFAFATAMRDFSKENFTLDEILAQINKVSTESHEGRTRKSSDSGTE